MAVLKPNELPRIVRLPAMAAMAPPQASPAGPFALSIPTAVHSSMTLSTIVSEPLRSRMQPPAPAAGMPPRVNEPCDPAARQVQPAQRHRRSHCPVPDLQQAEVRGAERRITADRAVGGGVGTGDHQAFSDDRQAVRAVVGGAQRRRADHDDRVACRRSPRRSHRRPRWYWRSRWRRRASRPRRSRSSPRGRVR